MKLKEYIKALQPINTIDKVEKLLLFIKTNGVFFDESTDYEIRMAIRKLSVQIYYVNNRPDFNKHLPKQPKRKPNSSSSISTSSKKEQRHAELVDKNRKQLKKEEEEYRKKKKRRKLEATIDYGLESNKTINGRDYSYRHPLIEKAIRKAANRTKEQQEKFDWAHRPRIVYTPMGGQNKKY